jgi:uncharacterized membrane protein YczE
MARSAHRSLAREADRTDRHAGRVPRPTARRLPARLVQLYVGLVVYGVAAALLVRSRLGLDPWDVFHQGLAQRLHLAIGTVVILVGAVVMLAWWPLRQRPGLGTLSNLVLVGLSLDATLSLLPGVDAMAWRVVCLLAGVLLSGLATGMYIGADFGPGPRDGLMTGLHRMTWRHGRTGRSIRLVRTSIEVTVLVAGWLLGGTVGVGTVVYALGIGPLAQLFLPLFSVVVVEPREPGGETLDRRLELGVGVDEGL